MRDRLILVNKDGKIKSHYHAISPREKAIDESWLQRLLIISPDLLPTEEISPSFTNLIPLGREVTVTSGSIDNLYVTSEGLICLVETKLWRNPDAHRNVVAQVIDYAKDVAKLSFEEFKNNVEKSSIEGEKIDFWERVYRYRKNVNKIEFQSKIQESLEAGRFLLLIVGDKIYPEVAMLVESIQSAPHLEFKLGLVEIKLFSINKKTLWPVIVMSKVVGKSYEVTRSVVRIVYEKEKPHVEVAAIEERERLKGKTNQKTFIHSMPKEFADLFMPIFEQWLQEGIVISWGEVGFSVRFFWQGKMRSIVDIYPNSISLLTDAMVKRRKLPLGPYLKYKKEINNIPIAKRILSEDRRYVDFEDLSLEDFKRLIDTTDRLIREYKKLEEKPLHQ